MPGPIAACARSTGAMLPRCRCASAIGSSVLSALTNSRRVAVGASVGARPADEDDAGGEGVVARNRAVALACSVRIGQVPLNAKAGPNHSVQKCLPTGTGSSVLAIALGLLECVVNRDRKRRMRLLGETVHRLRHAIEEERSAFSFRRDGTASRPTPRPSAQQAWRRVLGTRSASGEARRRRSPISRRNRCCRSRADQWRRLSCIRDP